LTLKLVIVLIGSVCFLGCKSPEQKEPIVKDIIWHEQDIIQKRSKPKAEIQIIAAPDVDNHIIRVSGFEDIKKLSSTVSIKIERAWQDQHNYYFIVAIQNDTDKGTRANFYVFSHDALGRVINVQVDDFFFKDNESKFKRIVISKNSQVKKWSMSVK
jgi:hypothetical protein